MGHLSQSLTGHIRGIAKAIVSFSSSIVDHFTPKRRCGNGDSDEEEDDDDDSNSIFEEVLERVKAKRIREYVTTIRAKTLSSDKKKVPSVEVGSPTYTGEHVCYRVKFADGVNWMLKIPAIGTPDQFDKDDAEALRSEALTMIMLRRETTIPIPEVISYDNTCKNKLKVPFLLMEFIDARPLDEVWHDRESPKEVVQARRTRCLRDIAAAYIQLGKYTFNESTPLKFDDQDCLVGIVPVNNDPFSGLREACTSCLDRWGKDEVEFRKGLLKLLRMFVGWTPESNGGKSFVLSHPNPNIFNFLVSEDGSVRAILDWHGAHTTSPSIGNESYPLWLMRDWDPSVYIWTEEMEQGIHNEENVWEDSPDTLKFYRDIYAQYMVDLRPESENAKVTRNSLLFRHLMMAAGDPMFSLGITEKILLEAMRRVDKNSNNEDSETIGSSKDHSTGDHNSPNETEDAGHGGIEADSDGEDEEEFFDIYEFLQGLNKDGLCEHRQKLFKTGFDALFVS